MRRQKKFYAWGYADEDLGPDEIKPWEAEHEPNLTGTPRAYRPEGSLWNEGKRPAATGDYEAWRPN